MKTIIIEDERLLRDTLARSLTEHLGIDIVGTFNTPEEALAAEGKLNSAELALLDIRLGTSNIFSSLPRIRAAAPSAKVILVSSITEGFLLEQAFSADVHGFVHKDDSLDIVLTAIRAVSSGQRYTSGRVLQLWRDHIIQPDRYSRILSKREQEVLCYLGAGMPNEEIGDLFGLSPGTVHSHRRNIMNKLDLHSAAELQAYAIQHGFTSAGKLRK